MCVCLFGWNSGEQVHDNENEILALGIEGDTTEESMEEEEGARTRAESGPLSV